MAQGRKSPFSNAPRPLPTSGYVPLTEAITWIAYCDARDDDFMDQWIREKSEQSLEKWGSQFGAEDLLPHLELLEKGQTWLDVTDIDWRHVPGMMRGLREAERWLERNGLTLKQGIDAAASSVNAEFALEDPAHRAMDVIWSACALQEVQLEGMPFDLVVNQSTGSHEPIDHRYFLKPVAYSMGRADGPKGLLSPMPSDSDEALQEQIEARLEHRSHYVQVLIRRSDVLPLEKRFRKEARSLRKGRTGRPDKYNWPAFHAELLRILDEEGEPGGGDPEWATAADIERRIAQWCEDNWSQAPVSSTVRLRIGHVVEEFRQKRAADN